MTNQDFKSTAKESLLGGAKFCFTNAKAHYLCAHETSKMRNYGIANSLLILSVEECIKCLILTAGYFSVEIPFDVKPFFSNHKVKHTQAADIQPIVNTLFKVKDSVIDIFKNRKPDSHFAMSVSIGLTFLALGNSLELKNNDDSKEKFSNWWSRANDAKNNGFYVDFKNNNWVLPSSIPIEIYNETLEMAKAICRNIGIY